MQALTNLLLILLIASVISLGIIFSPMIQGWVIAAGFIPLVFMDVFPAAVLICFLGFLAIRLLVK